MYAHIYTRAYAHSIVYTHTQFAQTNGLTMRTRVYIINASNAMPKPYLYTYVHAYARTYAHAVNREQYSQTNATHARKRTHANSSLHSTCGRFLRVNAIAFCALDLKLSGCTIYQCTIRTNSHSTPVGKHSDETAPTPLEHRLLAAI